MTSSPNSDLEAILSDRTTTSRFNPKYLTDDAQLLHPLLTRSLSSTDQRQLAMDGASLSDFAASDLVRKLGHKGSLTGLGEHLVEYGSKRHIRRDRPSGRHTLQGSVRAEAVRSYMGSSLDKILPSIRSFSDLQAGIVALPFLDEMDSGDSMAKSLRDYLREADPAHVQRRLASQGGISDSDAPGLYVPERISSRVADTRAKLDTSRARVDNGPCRDASAQIVDVHPIDMERDVNAKSQRCHTNAWYTPVSPSVLPATMGHESINDACDSTYWPDMAQYDIREKVAPPYTESSMDNQDISTPSDADHEAVSGHNPPQQPRPCLSERMYNWYTTHGPGIRERYSKARRSAGNAIRSTGKVASYMIPSLSTSSKIGAGMAAIGVVTGLALLSPPYESQSTPTDQPASSPEPHSAEPTPLPSYLHRRDEPQPAQTSPQNTHTHQPDPRPDMDDYNARIDRAYELMEQGHTRRAERMLNRIYEEARRYE